MPTVQLDTAIVDGKAVHTDPRTKQQLTAAGSRKHHSLVPFKPPKDNRTVVEKLLSKKAKPVVHHPTFGYATCKGQETRDLSSSSAAPRAVKKPASRLNIRRLLKGSPRRVAKPAAAATAAAPAPSVRQAPLPPQEPAAVCRRETWEAYQQRQQDDIDLLRRLIGPDGKGRPW